MASINFLIHGVLGRWFGRTSHNRGSIMHVLSVILCNTFFIFFLYRKDPGGNTAPSPSLGIFGDAIKGHRILMIWELLSCNFLGISTILKVQGTSRENILRLIFFGKLRARVSYPLATTTIGSSDIDGTGSLGFILFYFFLIPPYFSPFSPSRPHLLICPSHIVSRHLPNPLSFPLTCNLPTPHLPARRLIAVVVTEPWIWRSIR